MDANPGNGPEPPFEPVSERTKADMERIAFQAVRPRWIPPLWAWGVAPAALAAVVLVLVALPPDATVIRPYTVVSIEGGAQATRALPLETHSFERNAEIRLYVHPAAGTGELATEASLFVEGEGSSMHPIPANITRLHGAFRLTAEAADVFGDGCGHHTLWIGLARPEADLSGELHPTLQGGAATQWLRIDVLCAGRRGD